MGSDERQVQGLSDLNKFLQQFPVNIERNVMRGGLRAGTKVYKNLARANVNDKSGALSKSIRIRTRVRNGRVIVMLVAGNKTAFYVVFVEMGTAKHFIKPKNRKSLFFAGIAREVVEHPGAKQNPFMRPAYDAGTDEAINATAEYIRKRIPREVKKLAKLTK